MAQGALTLSSQDPHPLNTGGPVSHPLTVSLLLASKTHLQSQAQRAGLTIQPHSMARRQSKLLALAQRPLTPLSARTTLPLLHILFTAPRSRLVQDQASALPQPRAQTLVPVTSGPRPHSLPSSTGSEPHVSQRAQQQDQDAELTPHFPHGTQGKVADSPHVWSDVNN